MYNVDDAIARVDSYIVSVTDGGSHVGERRMVRIESVGRSAATAALLDARANVVEEPERDEKVESASSGGGRRRGSRGGRRRSRAGSGTRTRTDEMAMYAVVETGGKQYQVEKGTTLLVDRLSADEGAKVDLRPVAFRDKKMVVGKDLDKVKVEAKVAGHERGPKIRVFKYKAKKGYRKRQGHRSELTRLEVTDIKMLARKPAASSSAKKPAKTAAKKEAADGS